jgi:Uma2 family endonuclease
MELADIDLNRLYTYADYYKWTFEERVELIKGKIFKMSPAPGSVHQRVSSVLHVAIGSYLINGRCEVFSAPFDVRIPRKTKDDKDIITVLQPDICVICDPNKIDERGCVGAPDIVVEILSAGNSRKEMKIKYEVYEEAGVKEYWIVDPIRETVQVHLLKDHTYIPLRTLVPDDTLNSTVLPGFSFSLSKIFPATDGERE